MFSEKKTPFNYDILIDQMALSQYDNHVKRHLSDMVGYFNDVDAFTKQLAADNTLLYEVYDVTRPHVVGEMMHGLSIVHPGLVGNEYYMTKGHFHTVLETAEVYYCLKGQGVMVMETPEGEWAIKKLYPGNVLYVPPRWAHRTVNTSLDEDIVTFFIYPANAGHDYGSIEKQGFRKLVIHDNDQPKYVDNPRWLSPEERKS